jgi:hypothetical protein
VPVPAAEVRAGNPFGWSLPPGAFGGEENVPTANALRAAFLPHRDTIGEQLVAFQAILDEDGDEDALNQFQEFTRCWGPRMQGPMTQWSPEAVAALIINLWRGNLGENLQLATIALRDRFVDRTVVDISTRAKIEKYITDFEKPLNFPVAKGAGAANCIMVTLYPLAILRIKRTAWMRFDVLTDMHQDMPFFPRILPEGSIPLSDRTIGAPSYPRGVGRVFKNLMNSNIMHWVQEAKGDIIVAWHWEHQFDPSRRGQLHAGESCHRTRNSSRPRAYTK